MSLKKFKPVTAGTRWRTGLSYEEVTCDVPEKSLLEKKISKAGKNSSGRTTVRNRGGGEKKMYRIIDFKRDKKDIKGTVKTIEYDPNRSSFISLINYIDGEKRYIIAPKSLEVGSTIISGDAVAPEVGNALMLKNIPLGTVIHNIELNPGRGGILARSAGSYAQLTSKEEKYALIKLPSGEIRKVLVKCYATVGEVSNKDNNLQSMGKAGRNRWRGKRPRNRGVSMNPVDHPMGGGEGKASGGQPRSRKGLYSKGLKTRKKRHSDKLIISRKK